MGQWCSALFWIYRTLQTFPWQNKRIFLFVTQHNVKQNTKTKQKLNESNNDTSSLDMFRQSMRRHLKVNTSTFTALMSRHGQMWFMDVLKWNCVSTQTENILTWMKLSAVRLHSLDVNKLNKDCKNILLIKFLYGENSSVIQYKCNFT